MRNGNTPLGAVLQSEAGAVRACRKIPMGILPQHNLQRRGASGYALRGRNSRLRVPRVKGFECVRRLSVYVLACAAIFMVCRVAVCVLRLFRRAKKSGNAVTPSLYEAGFIFYPRRCLFVGRSWRLSFATAVMGRVPL